MAVPNLTLVIEDHANEARKAAEADVAKAATTFAEKVHELARCIAYEALARALNGKE